jgi:two-component system LytT family response regulator
MAFRAMIIDDESLARERLRKLLAKHEHEIVIIDEAENGIEALEKINRLSPDLIFLDIHMPALSGLDLVKKLTHQPIIVFTTAHDEYAISAFATNSIEYLLKPIQQDDVDRAIRKLRNLSASTQAISQLFEYLQSRLDKQYVSRITCKIGTSINLINIRDIQYIQSRDKYTNLFTDKGMFPVETPLSDLEGKLDPQKFLRIHRGTIVNYDFIEKIIREDDSALEVVMADKQHTRLQVSRTYAPTLRSM